MPHKSFFRIVISTAVLCLIALTTYAAQAKPGQEEEVAITYVGNVTENEDEFVGVGIIDGEATVYICDGQSETGFVGIAQWFIGSIEDNHIDITTEAGDRVEVTLTETTGEGQFTFADGSVRAFSLALVEDEDAGLFRSEFAFGEDLFVGGWIILADGTVRGAVLRRATDTTPALLSPASFRGFSFAETLGDPFAETLGDP